MTDKGVVLIALFTWTSKLGYDTYIFYSAQRFILREAPCHNRLNLLILDIVGKLNESIDFYWSLIVLILE